MNFLEERILKDGVVKEGHVLKVDSFLNHQMDVALLDKIGEEFHRRFKDTQVTKVLTIEASGIAIAYAVARCFGVPMVFAKKAKRISKPDHKNITKSGINNDAGFFIRLYAFANKKVHRARPFPK